MFQLYKSRDLESKKERENINTQFTINEIGSAKG
ncbi:hypothetical protein IMCC3317_44770 [Kordia antarctica]|uniref:Uncharacterized protein n=1 Tax=Kordia antarctica TaxID=1218801 RepID=A0A7L4ZSQ0_9FLAO|nr:hypothetical protein IMCC3317_44770 [Kordia antarctica]